MLISENRIPEAAIDQVIDVCQSSTRRDLQENGSHATANSTDLVTVALIDTYASEGERPKKALKRLCKGFNCKMCEPVR
jgi:hypothetical protein